MALRRTDRSKRPELAVVPEGSYLVFYCDNFAFADACSYFVNAWTITRTTEGYYVYYKCVKRHVEDFGTVYMFVLDKLLDEAPGGG